mgnify:CR=1 FL=1
MLRPIETLLLLHDETEDVQDVLLFFTSKGVQVRAYTSAANVQYKDYDKVLVTLEVAKRLHASTSVTVLLDSYEQFYIMIPVCADSFVTRDTLMYALYTNKEKFVSGKRINRRQHHEYAKELESLISKYEKTKVEYELNLEVVIKVHFDFKKDVYKVGKKEFYITDSEKLFLYQYFIASVPRERKTIKYKLIKKFGVDIFDAQYKNTI